MAPAVTLPAVVAPPASDNRLLALLSAESLGRMIADLEPVTLKRNVVLHEPGVPIKYVYFPTSGTVSMIIESGIDAVEVASVGNEGFTGVAALLLADTMTTRAVVQASGHAYRMRLAPFRVLLDECAEARLLFSRFALALFHHVAQSVACNRLHSLEARCARWLLDAHDRVEGDQLLLTQESLSYRLGVHRPAVTLAAGSLHKAGFIAYSRGKITITNRSGLESAACCCYRLVRDDYESLLGSGAASG